MSNDAGREGVVVPRCNGLVCRRLPEGERNPVGPGYSCPYQLEINDEDVPCDCCDRCRQECRDDI